LHLHPKVKLFVALMNKDIVEKLDDDLKLNKRRFRNFINRQEQKLRDEDLGLVQKAEQHAWDRVDCLSCANCCKKMSPTYTREDIERISAHLKMSPAQFKKKW